VADELLDFFEEAARRDAASWPAQPLETEVSELSHPFYRSLTLHYSWGQVWRSCDLRDPLIADSVALHRHRFDADQVARFEPEDFLGDWWRIATYGRAFDGFGSQPVQGRRWTLRRPEHWASPKRITTDAIAHAVSEAGARSVYVMSELQLAR